MTWRQMLRDVAAPIFILERRQRWNDQGYRTLFHLVYRRAADGQGDFEVGPVKVLQRGRQLCELPSSVVDQLPDDFCSLGQSEAYYERLDTLLPKPEVDQLLRALRDITKNPSLDASFQDEAGYRTSLLRSSEARRVYTLRRAPPTSPATERVHFIYTCELEGFLAPHRIPFDFYPADHQLGRIVALVGKNATGKTRILRELGRKLSGLRDGSGSVEGEPLFSRIIAVAYGAFDDFRRYEHWNHDHSGVAYFYCGLRDRKGNLDLQTCRREILAKIRAMDAAAGERWREWLGRSQILELEQTILSGLSGDEPADAADSLAALSSGHQIMVLVLTNLAITLQHRSLVLFDEPELHLHPNLLSALMRVLHSALEDSDSFAIIATHSPQVLQEIPARGIRILERHFDLPSVRSYPRESFGANLGEIVDLAFGVSEMWKNYRMILETEHSRLSPTKLREIFRMPHASLPVAMTLDSSQEDP